MPIPPIDQATTLYLVKTLFGLIVSKESISLCYKGYKYLKNKHNKKSEEKKNSRDVKKDIDYLLDDLLEINQCDRAYACVFHNGSETSTGIHFDKISMRYERVRPGISEEKHRFQNLSLDDYSEHIDFLVENKFKIVHDTGVLNEGEVKEVYLEKGVKSYYMTLIRSKKKKKLVTLVGIEFVLYSYKDIHNEEILKELDYYAHRIAYRLTDNKKFLK